MDSQIQLLLSCRNKRGALLPPSRMNGGERMATCRCHPTSCTPENQGRKIVCPCRLEPEIQIRVARAKVSIFATQLHDTVDARWHWLIGRYGHTATRVHYEYILSVSSRKRISRSPRLLGTDEGQVQCTVRLCGARWCQRERARCWIFRSFRSGAPSRLRLGHPRRGPLRADTS